MTQLSATKPKILIKNSFLPNHTTLQKKYGRLWHDKAIDIYKTNSKILEDIYRTGKPSQGIAKEDLVVNN